MRVTQYKGELAVTSGLRFSSITLGVNRCAGQSFCSWWAWDMRTFDEGWAENTSDVTRVFLECLS
jgi:hypothetical protein